MRKPGLDRMISGRGSGEDLVAGAVGSVKELAQAAVEHVASEIAVAR